MRTSRVTNALLDLQSQVLELIAAGASLVVVGDLICREVAILQSGIICTIVRVDHEGKLRPWASPGLPDYYTKALDGVPIGPGVGSCGTAAYTGEAVEVRDIATDPLWADFKELALPLGLRACWSSPIKDRDGKVIGTFAFYYATPRGPDDFDRQIVDRCTRLCAIAIEHQDMFTRLHRLAYFDTLSGLPNRANFNQRLSSQSAMGRSFGLVIFDLDHLKSINDTFGHQAGDDLMRAVSVRFGTLAQYGECYRIGGDEFAVIIANCESSEALEGFGHAIVGMMEIPVQSLGHEIRSSVTAGGAIFEPGTMDAETVLQNADLALYHGKTTKRGSFVAFHSALRTSITIRRAVIGLATVAVTENQVFPYYQPIVRIDTGEIVGLEALARIRTSDGEILAAGEFSQAFEDSKIAAAITGQMLVRVASDLRHWLDLGIPFQHVGFNVTTADFQEGDLVERIAKEFAEKSVSLKHIILEVNEAVFMGKGNSHVTDAVGNLREKGLLVALDDFGTGYASLTHLLDFPVDIIKIDKGFVARLMHHARSASITGAIVQLARELDMRVVAEGVETSEQAGRLLQLGCRLGQGYHYSRPVSSGDAQALMERFAQRPGQHERFETPLLRA